MPVAKLKPGMETGFDYPKIFFVSMFRRTWHTIEELNVKQPVDMLVPQVLRGDAVGEANVLRAGRLRVRFPILSLTSTFRPHCVSGVSSASNRNE
jgi:hypothetical protein